jgi:hypothetical protein
VKILKSCRKGGRRRALFTTVVTATVLTLVLGPDKIKYNKRRKKKKIKAT